MAPRIAEGAALACASVAFLLAGLGLLGWVTPWRGLASLSAASIPMAPSSALALLLLGATLMLDARQRSPRLTFGVASILLMLGGVRLARYAAGWPLLLDPLLDPNAEVLHGISTGQISPLTALGLFAAALSLLLIGLAPRQRALGTAGTSLAVVACLLGVTVTLGYIFGAPLLHGGLVVPMALSTALAVACLGLALIGLSPGDSSVLRPFIGPTLRAKLLRAFLPIAPAVVGIHALLDRVAGLNPGLDAALTTLLSALVVAGIVAYVAQGVGSGLDRTLAERERSRHDADRLAAIVHSSSDAIYARSLDGTLVAWNPSAERLFGYAPEEALGRSATMLLPPSTRDDITDTLVRIRAGERVEREDAERIRKDGSHVFVSLSESPMRDDSGQVVGISAIARDVSEQRRVEAARRQSEANFRQLAEAMPQIVWIRRPDGWNLYCNQQWMDYTGLTLEQSLGDGWNAPFHPEDRQRALDAWQSATATLSTYALEARLRRADGVYRWWLVRGVPVRDAAGTILEWYGTCTDIHDLKLAQIEVTRSEQQFARVFQSNLVAIGIGEISSGRLIDVNGRWEEFFGYTRDEALGRTVPELGLLADPASQERLLAGFSAGAEVAFRHKSGETRYAMTSLEAMALDGVAEPLAMMVLVDMTERRQLESQLLEARNRMQQLVRESPAVIYALQLGSEAPKFAWISENVQGLLGYSVEEALAPRWWFDRVHPDEGTARLAEQREILPSGRLVREYRFRHGDGTYRWLRDEQRVVRDPEGQPTEIVGSWSDITAQKSAEQRLIESEKEYRLLFDSNPHAMWVFDAETLAFLAVNDAAVRLYGFSREEFLSMTIEDIRPEAEIPALLAYLQIMPDGPSVPATQVRHHKKDGSLIEVAGASNPIAFGGRRAQLVLAIDVTEKKELEAQLLQAQKMDAVGRLAGGVAHDFNNQLGVILGYTELLLRQASEAQQGKLEQILKATQRASGLTQQLLAFSRKQIIEPKVVDLDALLADLETMLGRLIGEDIDLARVRGGGLGQVKADAGQLEQVVVNLCVNARDAMVHGGELRVATANADVDTALPARPEPIPPGRYVTLVVSDTGCGIDAKLLPNIFEPFFTTKEKGKGTGLGLAMVYGTIKQAGGHIAVESVVGRGTTFRIYLPRLDELSTAVVAQEVEAPARGWETVLLVEDEAPLRAITRELLEEHGYQVIEAGGGEQAIEIAREHSEPIHLLLTDVVMPGLNGRALAEALVASRPGLRVLYMSGYTDDVIAQRGVLDPGTLLLNKPFTASTLLGRVRAALGEPTMANGT